MAAKRTLKFKAWLGWFLTVSLAWVGACYGLKSVDALLFSTMGHCLSGYADEVQPQLLRPGEDAVMQEVLTEKRILSCPCVGMVELNEKTMMDSFAALPLGPQDMAVLLSYLSQAGVDTVGVSAPFTWNDEAGDMARRMFCQVLGRFKSSALGLRGRTAAQADFTPSALRDAAIPADNVQGDPTGLPSANRPLPNGLADMPDDLSVIWAPDWLEDEPHTQKASAVEDDSFPLLIRWNGETIPTLPFRLALQRLGLQAKDVGVRLGKDIRFGGRVLPLDAYGRTKLTRAAVQELPPAKVVKGGEADLKELGIDGCVIIAESAKRSGDPQRLRLLAATLSELAGIEKSEYIKSQRPVGGMVLALDPMQQSWWNAGIALLLLALGLRILPFAPRGLRIVLLSGLALWLLYHAYEVLQSGRWFSLSASLLACVLAAVAVHRLKPEEHGIFRNRNRRR